MVSESELNEISLAAFNYWDILNNGRIDNSEEDDFDRYDTAKAACRARPISEEQALLLGPPNKYDLEMKILKDAGD